MERGMEKVLSDDTFLFWDLRPGGLKPAISPESASSDLEKPAGNPVAPNLHAASSANPAAQAPEDRASQAQARPEGASPAPAAPAARPASVAAASPTPAPAAMQKAPGQERLPGAPAGAKAEPPSPMPQGRADVNAPQAPSADAAKSMRAEPQGLDAQCGGTGRAAPQTHEPAFAQPREALTPAFGDPPGPSYSGWHLRKKRADVFVDLQSSAPFIKPLVAFLQSKGLSVLGYDPRLHYLPYDVILADKARLGAEGRSAALDGGKAAVWAFLKRSLAGRI